MKPRAPRIPASGKATKSSRSAESGLVQRNTLHQNPWFSVHKRGKYYTIEYRQPQAIILPVVDNRGIVLVRVKRPVIDDTPLELPAGGIEVGETPAAGAAREFSEETGIVVSDVTRFLPMPPISPSPNRTPNRIHVFRVDITRKEFARRGSHDDEIVGVEYIPFGNLIRRIACGEIYVAAPLAIIAAFLLANQKKELQKLRAAARKRDLGE